MKKKQISDNNHMETIPDDFPYGAYITIFLNGTIQFDLEQFDYSLGDNLFLQFVENKKTASEFLEVNYSGSKAWDVKLTGFRLLAQQKKPDLSWLNHSFGIQSQKIFQ